MSKVLAGTLLSLAGAGLLPGSLLAQGFASSVVVAGDEILVAESRARGADGGVVYIYTRSGDTWVQTGRFTHPEPSEGNGFGISMAHSGDRLLVTAANLRSPEGGGVHAFSRGGSGWSHDGQIVADGLPEGMILGMATALSGDISAINAGSRTGDSRVLLFRNVDGGWVQEAMLESPVPEERTGFGGALALSGGTLVVGAPAADSASGAAYVYEGGSDGWTMTGELTIADGPGSYFGVSAMVLADRILVGAGSPFDQPGSLVSFTRQDGDWIETGRLAAFDGSGGDQFGSSMATDGQTLWVGAPGANGRKGGIYEFAGSVGGDWTSVSKVAGSTAEVGDWMGTVVALGNGVLVSGMPRDDYGLGTATIFEREGDGWTDGFSVFSEVEGMDPVLGSEVECAEGAATVFGCSNVDLVSFVPVEDLGGARGVRVNDVWGWTDPVTERDYAIVGRTDGTSFVDVTDPLNPVVVGNLPKPEWAPGSSWRDMKVYKRPCVRGLGWRS